jgi:transposase
METIGIDVSKNKLDVLWLRDIGTKKVKTRVFKNNKADHQALLNWLIKTTGVPVTEIHCVMEATGIYHEALAYVLHKAGVQVCVANPAKVKAHGNSLGVRNKTDKKDSYVIAHYGATMRPQPWQPEPVEIRELKALIARHQAIEKDLQRELNRLEKVQFTQVSSVVEASIVQMADELKQQKAYLEKQIDEHIDQHPTLKKDRRLLESIDGVGSVVSMLMVALLRSREFTCARQCAAFVGLNPVQYESGSSVKRRSRLSKAGDPRIRAKLYMAAVVATRCNPDIRQQYERLLKAGKSKMCAIGAAMRKLVHICFGVVKHQTEFQPQGL